LLLFSRLITIGTVTVINLHRPGTRDGSTLHGPPPL
jgi:hypothetical protein